MHQCNNGQITKPGEELKAPQIYLMFVNCVKMNFTRAPSLVNEFHIAEEAAYPYRGISDSSTTSRTSLLQRSGRADLTTR